MPTFFITGAEGSGKSSLIPYLKDFFPTYSIHDFDDVGVPDNPQLEWRLETTQYWVNRALENQNDGKITIISGLTFPSEIEQCKDFKLLDIPIFCLLEVTPEIRKKRLSERKNSHELIKDTNQLVKLKEEFENLKHIHTLINTSNQNVIQTSVSVIEYIERTA